ISLDDYSYETISLFSLDTTTHQRNMGDFVKKQRIILCTFYLQRRKKMRENKKLRVEILLGLFCILAMLLSACNTANGNESGAKAPDSQQIFRYPTSVETDFQTIDPALIQNAEDGYASQMIFTGLVQLDNNGNVKDQLAQSHEVSQDGLTYTFHLRP